MSLGKEKSDGGVEYKWKITSLSEEKLERIATQMKYRIQEGGGEAIYEIGVRDNGQLIGVSERELELTLSNLRQAAEKIGAKITILRELKGREGKIVEVLVRRTRENNLPIFLMIPVLGNVDSGKSTLISVLLSNELDDGNSLAMKKICRFKHELETGRTSSISTHVLGFDDKGEVINYSLISPFDEVEVYLRGSKIVMFVDLGGHERYFGRTTLKGIMGHIPDYAALIVAANAGIQPMTKEHLGVCIALKIPIFIVVTKIDLVHREIVDRCIEDIKRLLKMPGVNKIPIIIENLDDAIVSAKNMPCGRVAPIFVVSNKTGEGLDLLRNFLNLLPPRLRWNDHIREQFKMYIDDKWNVKGAGPVVSGIILSGKISQGEILFLGPFHDGSFKKVRVKSIRVCNAPVEAAIAGQEVTLALANVEYKDIRKGMVLLEEENDLKSVRRFIGDIIVLHHPTTIWEGYQAVIHVHTIRQTAKFEKLSKEPLRSGDRAEVTFRFMYKPEYVEPGQVFMFREGRTRGIGWIKEIVG